MSEPNKTNRIEDAGEFIAGARKDWHLNAMSKSDIDNMTDEEIVTLVKKDNVWPKPDFEKLIAGGMEPLAAAMIKLIRDQLPQQPRDWRGLDILEGRKAFVDLVGVVRDMAYACKTPDDVRELFARYDDYCKENNVGARKWAIYKSSKTPLFLSHTNRIKAYDMVKNGFPSEENAWKRNLKVVQWRSRYAVIRSKSILKEGFDSEQEAWDWAKENATKRKRTVKKDQKIEPKRPHLDHLVRQGLGYERDGKDITPEDFLETFGFRGVQFGNWLPNSERQQVLNLGYEALMDLSEVLGWEPKALSLEGTLGIAFGARGTGRAAAHYEPGQRVINMTKLSGAGSLAHEFAHALDHWLGTGTTADKIPGGIPSATGWDISDVDTRDILSHRDSEVSATVRSLMGSFYNKDLTKEERLEKITGRIDHLKSEIEKHKKNLVMIKEKNIESLNRKYLRDVPRWISLQEVAIADMENEIDLINKGQITDFGQGQTNYYTEAQKLCGSSDYYKRPNELFARAFESWVFDEIKDRGGSSDYLVHSVSDGLFAGDEFKGNPYPSGDERKTINSKLVLFTDAVKAEVEMHLENSSTPRM